VSLKVRTLVISLMLVSLLAGGMSQPLDAGKDVLAQDTAAAWNSPIYPDASALFIENVGQFHADARFYTRVAGRDVWLMQTGLWITTMEDGQPVNLEVRFPEANPALRLEPFDRQETIVNYFRTPDPRNWHTGVPTWGGVRYVGLYPGVDVEISSTRGQLVWRMVCRAECPAIPAQVNDGAITTLRTLGEDFTPLLARDALFIFQAPPAGLIYSSYLGGNRSDGIYALAIGADGAAYVTGQTYSPDLPVTPGAVDPTTSGNEAFVAKIAPDGNGLVYLTYLGGAGADYGTAIAVNAQGAAYVGGWTNSADFPATANAFQRHLASPGDNVDAFVAVLSPDGTQLRYATYLGGNQNDYVGFFSEGNPIAVGGDGAIYVAGLTFSPDFPTTSNAFDRTYNQWADAFVTVFEPHGALRYSTFLGGSDSDEQAYGIAVGADGAAYVVGETNSVDFPVTASAFQSSLHDLYKTDGFLTVLAPDGSALRYSTYFGGAGGYETLYGVAVGSDGAAYGAGTTDAYDLPVTPGVVKPISPNAFARDAFVAVLDPGRSGAASLRCATYFGGDETRDDGYGMALSAAGDIYLVGMTHSSDMPTTPDAVQPAKNAQWDTFVAVLSPDCRTLRYASYLGGGDGDTGYAVAAGPDGSAYVAGETWSGNFPTTDDAFQPVSGGSTDGFVARIRIASRGAISGRVQDDEGNPLAGIVISTNAGHSAITAADGRYTLANMPVGVYTVTPGSGYLWTPEARVVTLPPDATGQDFVGRNSHKTVTPATYQGTLMLGDRLTYTVRLVFPDNTPRSFYDAIPTHTTYVPGSLSAPVGVAYDAEANAIVGPLSFFTPGEPFEINFVVRSGIMGTVGFAPQIVNRACFYPTGETPAACVWSNEVRTFSYVVRGYLPLVVRSAP